MGLGDEMILELHTFYFHLQNCYGWRFSDRCLAGWAGLVFSLL
jgi:hypothetical protein